ncbi:MAG TPA: 16S rRNA (guanine(527)-N(7))-methyltransferase RsmG [Burkholderiales bacterium]
MTPAAALDEGLGELGIGLHAGAREQLLRYLELLAKWNRTYNLTAIRDPLEMVSHHVLDSLAVMPHLPVPDDGTLADVGSGAGLPGIPLAIARPQWQVTLNDASQKRTAFLRQAAMELALGNVAVHEGRAEAWRPAARFAVVISRAFAQLTRFIASCRHLVRPGGVLAAMTGAAPGEDCGGEVIALRVPLLDAERHLVLCRVER